MFLWVGSRQRKTLLSSTMMDLLIIHWARHAHEGYYVTNLVDGLGGFLSQEHNSDFESDGSRSVGFARWACSRKE